MRPVRNQSGNAIDTKICAEGQPVNAVLPDPEMKRCTTCREIKPLTGFYARSNRPSGVHPSCKECSKSRAKKRYAETRAVEREIDAEVGPGEKRCSTCREVKSQAEFHRVKKSPDGKSARCKACVREYQQSHFNRPDRPGPPDSKFCTTCEKELPGPCFHNSKSSADGLQQRCKDCQRESKRAYAKNNPERVSRLRRERRLMRMYKLTIEEFDQRLAAQGGECFICHKDDPGPKGWQVDHDHSCCPGDITCGKCIRKILCSRCNLTLGRLEEDIDLILSLASYLQMHSLEENPIGT